MPKLNLDIFSTEAAKPAEQEPNDVVDVGNGSGPRQKSVSGSATKKGTSSASNNPGPKFVPVGFYPRHLSLLDDAVLKLRRSGHWRASKSAIIRNLIEANAEDLERFGRNDE